MARDSWPWASGPGWPPTGRSGSETAQPTIYIACVLTSIHNCWTLTQFFSWLVQGQAQNHHYCPLLTTVLIHGSGLCFSPRVQSMGLVTRQGRLIFLHHHLLSQGHWSRSVLLVTPDQDYPLSPSGHVMVWSGAWKSSPSLQPGFLWRQSNKQQNWVYIFVIYHWH